MTVLPEFLPWQELFGKKLTVTSEGQKWISLYLVPVISDRPL